MEIQTSERCDRYDKMFARLVSEQADEAELSGALADLSAALDKHYGIAPMIIIDEYDIPIQQGYMHGFTMIFVCKSVFRWSEVTGICPLVFMTGILQGGQRNIFSGLNVFPSFGVIINTVPILDYTR